MKYISTDNQNFNKNVILVNLTNENEVSDIYLEKDVCELWKPSFDNNKSKGAVFFSKLFDDDKLYLKFNAANHIDELCRDIESRFEIQSIPTDKNVDNSKLPNLSYNFLKITNDVINSRWTNWTTDEIKNKYFSNVPKEFQDDLLRDLLCKLNSLDIINFYNADSFDVKFTKGDWLLFLYEKYESKRFTIKEKDKKLFNEYNSFYVENIYNLIELTTLNGFTIESWDYGTGEVFENINNMITVKFAKFQKKFDLTIALPSKYFSINYSKYAHKIKHMNEKGIVFIKNINKLLFREKDLLQMPINEACLLKVANTIYNVGRKTELVDEKEENIFEFYNRINDYINSHNYKNELTRIIRLYYFYLEFVYKLSSSHNFCKSEKSVAENEIIIKSFLKIFQYSFEKSDTNSIQKVCCKLENFIISYFDIKHFEMAKFREEIKTLVLNLLNDFLNNDDYQSLNNNLEEIMSFVDVHSRKDPEYLDFVEHVNIYNYEFNTINDINNYLKIQPIVYETISDEDLYLYQDELYGYDDMSDCDSFSNGRQENLTFDNIVFEEEFLNMIDDDDELPF